MSKRRRRQVRPVYMHTLNDEPAYFDPGCGLVLTAFHSGTTRCVQALARSLRELRHEQAISKEARPEIEGAVDEWRYGFVRLHVPLEED